MSLRIAFTVLGIGALMAGFWEAGLLVLGGVIWDALSMQPEVDAIEAVVEAAGIDGETGRTWSCLFTVIMCLVIIGVLYFGAEELMMRGGQ